LAARSPSPYPSLLDFFAVYRLTGMVNTGAA